MDRENTLFIESVLDYTAKKADRYKVPLIASLVLGFLAYGFNLTNKLINHDEITCLFSKGATVSSGRWGLDILERVFPNVSMPWIYGIITLVLVTISVCVICSIFNIRSKLLQVLLAGAIVTFPSLTSTMSYMFTASSYAVAFFAAVLSVLMMQKHTKTSVLAATVLLVFSLSIYQAYVAVAASFLVLILIQRLMQGADVKKVLHTGIGYVVFLAVSLVLYYISTQLIFFITGQSFGGYAENNLSLSFGDIPGKIILAYERFFLYFRRVTHGCGLISTPLSRKMHYILALTGILLFFAWLISQKETDWPRLLLLIALLGILPLAINCMFLFTSEDAIHTLVLYSFASIYVLVIIMADLDIHIKGCFPVLVHRICLELSPLILAVIVISNIYTANEASLNLYLHYENSYSFYTALAADIKMMPEFDENTRIAVCGEYREPTFYREHLFNGQNMAGTAGFSPDYYSKDRFVEYYLGFPLHFVSEEEAAAIATTPEYAQMACYPYYGSMRFIGDVLVVKLS